MRVIKSAAILLEPSSASASDGKVFVGFTEERFFALNETFKGRKLSLISPSFLSKLRRYADAPEGSPYFNLPSFTDRKSSDFVRDIMLTTILFTNHDSRREAQDHVLNRHDAQPV